MPKKLTVVISQHQGKNPAKRHLEEEIAAALIMESDVDVSIVPHLYDLDANHTGTLFLRSVPGDMVVLSWLYSRAARWTLDRQNVKGREGVTLLKSEDEDEKYDDDPEAADDDEPQGIGAVNVPDRRLYCVDLRTSADPRVYLDEVRRIAREASVQTVDLLSWIQGSPQPAQLQRYLQPERMLAASRSGNGDADDESDPAAAGGNGHRQSADLPEPTRRRWYPVIDYSRCTNCMECIDFCLFGVYGVDQLDRILVEEQDNCKKGCPACSRVCPENAIIFPGHKTPAIAGAEGEVAGLKIDLSKLFGAPEKSALELAVEERDIELVRDGRDAVGMSVGIPKRQAGRDNRERDELDDLIDGLDGMDL
jgi:NAD-dependent dihydropyrimidine dehydrogenase PreA subunit